MQIGSSVLRAAPPYPGLLEPPQHRGFSSSLLRGCVADWMVLLTQICVSTFAPEFDESTVAFVLRVEGSDDDVASLASVGS